MEDVKVDNIVKDNRIILSIMITTLVFLLTSCSQIDELAYNSVLRSSYAYSSQSIDIYDVDSYTTAYNVISYDNNYYTVVNHISVDSTLSETYLYCINDNGEITAKVPLNPSINPYVASDIIDDEFVYTTFSGKLEKVDLYTGEITYSESVGNNLCGVLSCDDGYVVLSIGRIDKYNSEDIRLASIENSDWQFYNGYRSFYQSGDAYYLLADTGFNWKYYQLDFDNSSSDLIYDPTQDATDLWYCSGPYIFDEEGEYWLDAETSCRYQLAKWSDMNLQPPQCNGMDPKYIGISDEIFIQVYSYSNGMSQLVVYNYDEGIDYSGRTIITVGGYNCRDDLALNWSIFRYNTSQSEYRVVIEEYSDNFGWGNPEEAASSKAALIAYFNNGNAPDIFYGNEFDYDSFQQSGALLDITQYMSNSFAQRFDEITPNIRNLMIDDNGSCYMIFSGYKMDGFSSAYDVESNLSINEAVEYAEEYGVTLYPNVLSMELAQEAIQFSLIDGELNEEDIQNILQYSVEYGLYDLSSSTQITTWESELRDYLMCYAGFGLVSVTGMNDVLRNINGDDELVFIGYPTINGSRHVIQPFGQMAISSATAYPEACTQVLSYLLNEEIQDMNNFGCLIPVNDMCMRRMVEYAQDHSLIPEEDYQYYLYLNSTDEVTEEAAEAFYSYIDHVDTVMFYDRGLVSIIDDELQTYYLQDKPIEEIAESLYSRLSLYLAE